MRIAQSSHIYAYEYDSSTQTLYIQFTNGAIYNYAGIPQTEYDTFSQSPSPGIYFHSKIKGNYRTTNVAAGASTKRGMK